MKKGKQKIMQVAFELIVQKGIKQTSVRDISKAAGISTGTFTYYYPNKEELLFDIFEMSITRQDELIEKALASNALEEKKVAFKEILRQSTSNEYFMKLNYYLIGEALAQNTVLFEKMKRKYEGWRQKFKEYLYKEVEGLDKDKELNATLLIAIIDGLTVQLLLDEESIPIEEMADKVIGIMYN